MSNTDYYIDENVIFNFISASFPKRFFAWLIDQAILLAILLPISFLYWGDITIETFQPYTIGVIQVWVLLNISYFSILEWWKEQTIGKKILKIRVLNEKGESIGFVNALLRRFGQVAIGLLGIIMIFDALAILKTTKNQRLFDLLADSVVMDDEYREESIKYLKGGNIIPELREKGVIQDSERTRDEDIGKKKEMLQEIHKRMDKLENSYGNGDIDKDLYLDLKDKYESRIKELRREIETES